MATETKTTAVSIFEPQKIGQLGELAKTSYDKNVTSLNNCQRSGEQLLSRAQAEGMSDSLDMEIERYITKTKATVKLMNERRSPLTQLFDRVRSEYTSIEAAIEPTKAGTIPYQLQQLRNQYAAQKRQEAERQRLEAERKAARERAIVRFRTDCTDSAKTQFNAYINECINNMLDLERSITLDNYQSVEQTLRTLNTALPQGWTQQLRLSVQAPLELSREECRQIANEVKEQLMLPLAEQYKFEIETNRDDILEHIPSKITQLRKAQQASAEEAECIRRQIAERERLEAERKEAERLEAERQRQAEAKLSEQRQHMDTLFGEASATVVTYQPKTSVKLRCTPLDNQGVMDIVAFWWSQEGCNLTTDELIKMFRRQITFAEKVANAKTGQQLISSEHIQYTEEIKAK